ncbi:MAG: hypothetical protein Ct9H300mP28_36110 [Pseudomonadota bacterium]|nr:MAG: hypothetical protein Ct9H300mP28_36110 [Pseudomonadota bacterium]
MEVIQLTGYTELEKHHIATQFLTPRQRKFHGPEEKQLRFRKSAIEEITHGYTVKPECVTWNAKLVRYAEKL